MLWLAPASALTMVTAWSPGRMFWVSSTDRCTPPDTAADPLAEIRSASPAWPVLAKSRSTANTPVALC